MKRVTLIVIVAAAMGLAAGCGSGLMRPRRDRGVEACRLELTVDDWDGRPLRGRWEAPRTLLEQLEDGDDDRRMQVRVQTGPGTLRVFSAAPMAAWGASDAGFGLTAATGTATFLVAEHAGAAVRGEFTLDAAGLAGRYAGIAGAPDGRTLLVLTLRGVDEAYLEMLADPDATLNWGHVERLHRHQVTGDYVRAIRRARTTPPATTQPAEASPLPRRGPLPEFTVDDIVHLAGRGVTAEYVQALQAGGYRFGAEALGELRFRGVSADWAVAWREAGFDLSADELCYLRFRGVDAAYGKAMREAALAATPAQLQYLRFRGITPAFARGFHAIGYTLTPEQLQYLRFRGVTPDDAAAMNDPDHELLTPKQLAELKFRGVDPALVRALRGQGSSRAAE